MDISEKLAQFNEEFSKIRRHHLSHEKRVQMNENFIEIIKLHVSARE